jgi:DNA (cytosine-5)-methyltransferase 1
VTALKLKAISLFSGVGGLDFGFEAAGFETAVALDLDPTACGTMRLNRPWRVIEGDLGGVSSADVLATAQLAPGEADVLIGGPPCQPFSKSGYWASGDASRLDDPRADTLTHFLRVLRDAQPRAFLLENVPGLAYRGKSEGLDTLRRGVDSINRATGSRYSFSWRVLNAADFGVPQLRERLFVIGARDGTVFRFPEPTHAPTVSLLTAGALQPYRTAWDALGDLPAEPNTPELRMTGKWADLLRTIPEGQNYLWHTERGGGEPLFGWRRRYWSFLLKLAKDRPSWTIQAQPGPATGPFHWRNRKLSAAELGRLQTFPDGLMYDCSRSDAQRLIGNAVPSALAEALALEIRRQLLRSARRGAALRLLPPQRANVPPPETIVCVPKKYLALAGEHEAHPGTGKGRRAIARALQAA